MYTNQQNILQKQMAEAQCEEKRYAGEGQRHSENVVRFCLMNWLDLMIALAH